MDKDLAVNDRPEAAVSELCPDILIQVEVL